VAWNILFNSIATNTRQTGCEQRYHDSAAWNNVSFAGFPLPFSWAPIKLLAKSTGDKSMNGSRSIALIAVLLFAAMARQIRFGSKIVF
jgi:hypothetical protein